MVSDDPTKQLPGNQVSHRPRFRLGERPWAYIGRIARHVTGGVDVQRTPHVSVVAVRVHTEAVVGVLTSVLAPQSVPGARVFVAVGIDHRGDPYLASLQPIPNRSLAGICYEVLRQQVSYFNRDPFTSVMTAHKQQLELAGTALPDPQGPDRSVLQAAADLPQFRDLRLALG